MKSKSVKVEGKTYLVHAKTESGLERAIKDLKKLVQEQPDIEDQLPSLEMQQ